MQKICLDNSRALVMLSDIVKRLRGTAMNLMSSTGILALSVGLIMNAGAATAQVGCAAGKTLNEGVLTIATSNPAYFPWVMDNDPASGKGFEAAVAFEVAARMGFDAAKVVWTAASFDESIQPGLKNFDFNLQQFSVTAEREQVVDFSIPYYSAAMAVLTRKSAIDAGVTSDLASLKGVIWGADASTTALPMLQDLIAPETAPLLYNDNTDVVAAMKANQVDAALFDLPTALYLGAVVLEDGVILGQFPSERSQNPDRFGLLMEEGNALKSCVDAAITAMTSDGTLAGLEAAWLQETTGVPVIK
jgi:polar amino acid transport system substrate-binding protein